MKHLIKARKQHVEQTCRDGEHAAGWMCTQPVSDLAFARAAAIFRAVGDEQRLRILERLAIREWCVSELASAEQEGLSTISQRLRILRAEGLVSRRREGKHIYYAIADQHVAHLVSTALAHAEEGRARSVGDDEEEDT
jgi:DNA-binding transcriptional ArsR family regulator